MKIGDFPLVERAIGARQALIRMRDEGTFGVTINGVYQDTEIVAECTPAIVAQLNARIAELDKDLEALGVRIS